MTPKVQQLFGERVRALREAAEVSQEDFAARANLDRTAFGKIERGLINVSLVTMARIAVELDVTLAELLKSVPIDAKEIRAIPKSTRGRAPLGGRKD